MNTAPEPTLFIGDITFDALHPEAMAVFWAKVLGYETETITDDFAAIVDPAGRRPRCCFQRTRSPKRDKNRIHLDLFAEDMAGEVLRLVELGAQKLRDGREGTVVWTVMCDIEGNEFCVQPPQY